MSPSDLQMTRIGVGAIVSYVVLSIALLDPLQAGGLIALSIICTLGLSLLMWIPIWWLTGWIVLAIVDLIRPGTTRSPSAQLQTTPTAVRDAIAISGYIRRSRAAGASDTQITTRLREQGWSEAEINRAFNEPSIAPDNP